MTNLTMKGNERFYYGNYEDLHFVYVGSSGVLTIQYKNTTRVINLDPHLFKTQVVQQIIQEFNKLNSMN